MTKNWVIISCDFNKLEESLILCMYKGLYILVKQDMYLTKFSNENEQTYFQF